MAWLAWSTVLELHTTDILVDAQSTWTVSSADQGALDILCEQLPLHTHRIGSESILPRKHLIFEAVWLSVVVTFDEDTTNTHREILTPRSTERRRRIALSRLPPCRHTCPAKQVLWDEIISLKRPLTEFVSSRCSVGSFHLALAEVVAGGLD